MAIRNLIQQAIGPLFEGILRFIPDKNERARAQEMFDGQILNALTGLVQGQLEINKIEAGHQSIFVAGWRPFIGWVCGSALVMHYLVLPLVVWVAFLAGYDLGEAPKLDIGDLMVLLTGMLGLGGLRTYEKRIGVARSTL
jgi:hypothetical protein